MKKEIIIGFAIMGLLIGGGVVGTQAMKQKSIERQLQQKLWDEKSARIDEEIMKDQAQRMYELCVGVAESEYWSYMKLNGTENNDGSVYALDRFWDRGDERKQDAIDNCYNQYLK